MWKNLNEFYSQNPIRRASPEADYGAHWLQSPWRSTWRVAYVKDTGEVYALYQGQQQGPVVLLGKVKADPTPTGEDQWSPAAPLYYETLNKILNNWPKVCGSTNNGLQWIKDQIAKAHQQAD